MKILDLLVNDINEDSLLRSVVDKGDYAIVYSLGHQFIDRMKFVKEFKDKDFFIFGHILDREDMEGYYELHSQCYIINLKLYKQLGCPDIGRQILNETHKQISPERSKENFHDDYTPLWVKPGTTQKEYKHKAHGWNILSIGFAENLPILVFNDTMRESKEFNYEKNR